MKKETRLKTKRLFLVPMTRQELEQTIAREENPELKRAYGEMLAGVDADPGNALWNTPWAMRLKKEGTCIGDLGFKGAPKKGTVELGYGVLKEYEGRGYTTEAVGAMIDWAFSQDGVYAIEAEAGNAASAHILEKRGFQKDGDGKEGPRYRREKPKSAWMTLYMCLGLSIGMSLGSISDNMTIGMCIGMCLGMSIGMLLDDQEKKRRAKVTGETEEKA